MNRALTLTVAGWLLFHPLGGVVAFYDTEDDCKFARKYAPGVTSQCIPDRFTVEEMRAQETEQ